jgi:hypothetical protein
MDKMDKMVYGKTKDSAKLVLNGRAPMSRSFTAARTTVARTTVARTTVARQLKSNSKSAAKERARREKNRLIKSFSSSSGAKAYGLSASFSGTRRNVKGSKLKRSVLRDPMLR